MESAQEGIFDQVKNVLNQFKPSENHEVDKDEENVMILFEKNKNDAAYINLAEMMSR